MMKPLKTAVIGMGTMGSKYAAFLLNGQVPAMELAAVTRVRPERLKFIISNATDAVTMAAMVEIVRIWV